MKTCNRSLFGKFWFCAAVAAAFGMVGPPNAWAGAGDAAGWELIFTDTFAREEPGKDWEVAKGSWKIEQGGLVGSGTLISARGFPGPDPHRLLPGRPSPGFIRLEFDVRLLPGATSADGSGVSALIHVPPADAKTCPTRTGYCFQFGGTSRILRTGKTLVERDDPESQLQDGSLHRCVVENDEGTLRMIVDGKVVFEQKETANILGDDFDRVGIDSDSVIRIERVRVYVKRLEEGYI